MPRLAPGASVDYSDETERKRLAAYVTLLPRFERDLASTQGKHIRAWKRILRMGRWIIPPRPPEVWITLMTI